MRGKTSSIFYRDNINLGYSRPHYFILASIVLLGLSLRFWGLGNVGLHGDEETMAMPALQILESGLPLLPSGMFYPRATGQVYLMASSVWVFGQTEWALRFPSAIVGSLGIVIAFYLGRRFLPPKWNILFVLILALLPSMIAVSQTARMYVFFSTFVMLFAVLIFRWEQTESWASLISAFIVFLFALQFHTLAIFASFLFFFPSVIRPSRNNLVQGAVAFVLGGAALMILRNWQGSQYGERLAGTVTNVEVHLSPLDVLVTHHLWVLGVSLFFLLAVLGVMLLRQNPKNQNLLAAVLLLAASSAASLSLHYHIAVILLGCGVVVYFRCHGRSSPLILFVAVFSVALALQLYFLYQSDLFPGRKVIGAVVGSPSVWPYLRFAEYFPIGFALYAVPLVYAAVRITRHSKIPDHFLLFVLCVWLPLFAIGFFKWYIPPRYMLGVVPFFVLACIAGVSYVGRNWWRSAIVGGIRYDLVAFPLLILAFVSPLELKGSVNVDYGRYPDHKGAASFMKALQLDPKDIILAEDVLQQTYYLGAVDYWLRAFDDAKKGFVKEKDGLLYDIYTDTPLIGNGKQLSALLQNQERGAVYIIGSGETATDRPYYLGNGIFEVMKLYEPRIVYTGRDLKTLVWYLPSPAPI